jgi:site-specific DNA-methyltransferase (adenine-specific)
MTIDLRCGRWQDALADVTCDAVICDPPYSQRTHAGRRTGSDIRQSNINYEAIKFADAYAFMAFWCKRATWFIVFGDHISNRWWLAAMKRFGLYTFHPVPWIKTDAAPRVSSEGPDSDAEYLAISRRKCVVEKRNRQGHYSTSTASTRGAEFGMPGMKPETLMRAIIRDYTEPGQIVCDPFAGSGTTLIAAASEGRNAIGSEMNPERFGLAQQRIAERIAKGFTVPMPIVDVPVPPQLEMEVP